jgi:catechol 2,3-dioxygenase-like lactoylglutathione lyase family enzyme
VQIEFVSTVAVIASDPAASRELYVGALGLPLEGPSNGYQHSEQVGGCRSFGVWPLSQAAEACFGTPHWPAGRPVPQVSIEFDVKDAAAVGLAAGELMQSGYELLHPPRQEPWGQTVARLQSPEGAILGISAYPHVPLIREAYRNSGSGSGCPVSSPARPRSVPSSRAGSPTPNVGSPLRRFSRVVASRTSTGPRRPGEQSC